MPFDLNQFLSNPAVGAGFGVMQGLDPYTAYAQAQKVQQEQIESQYRQQTMQAKAQETQTEGLRQQVLQKFLNGEIDRDTFASAYLGSGGDPVRAQAVLELQGQGVERQREQNFDRQFFEGEGAPPPATPVNPAIEPQSSLEPELAPIPVSAPTGAVTAETLPPMAAPPTQTPIRPPSNEIARLEADREKVLRQLSNAPKSRQDAVKLRLDDIDANLKIKRDEAKSAGDAQIEKDKNISEVNASLPPGAELVSTANLPSAASVKSLKEAAEAAANLKTITAKMRAIVKVDGTEYGTKQADTLNQLHGFALGEIKKLENLGALDAGVEKLGEKYLPNAAGEMENIKALNPFRDTKGSLLTRIGEFESMLDTKLENSAKTAGISLKKTDEAKGLPSDVRRGKDGKLYAINPKTGKLAPIMEK